MPQTSCEQCGRSITSPPSVPRRYCSAGCHDEARKKWANCRQCGERFRARRASKMYCNAQCGALGRRTKKKKLCVECGTPYLPHVPSQQYCSHRCGSVVQQRDRYASGFYKPRVQLTCAECHIGFTAKACHEGTKKYCSRKCKLQASRQVWPLEKTNLIEYVCAECGKKWHGKPSLKHRKKYCSRPCLGAAIVKRLQKESPTSIERATYAALASLGLVFEPQWRINRWVVDAFIPASNTIIECLGQFHHCDPRTYPDGPVHAIQRKTVERDIRRRADFQQQGYRMVELWEADIKSQGAESLLRAALL